MYVGIAASSESEGITMSLLGTENHIQPGDGISMSKLSASTDTPSDN